MTKKIKNKNNNKRLVLPIILSTLIVIIMAFTFKPLLTNTKFGLDLSGGFEVLYQVKSVDGSKLTDSMVTNTYKTILKRIDVLGVTEPNISIEGKNKIRIQLAGIKNGDEARQILSSTANLTFRDVNDNLIMNSSVLVSGGAKVSTDQTGNPAVGLTIKNKDLFLEGTTKISKMESGKNLMVVWLDYDNLTDSYNKEGTQCGTTSSNCLSAARVSEGFSSDVIIEGNFTQAEVSSMVDLINSGSLPTKLTEISSNTVDASFGANSLNKTLFAGIIGVLLIVGLMIALYRFAGLITSITMILYTFLVFLVFYLVGGVLTLPGIAALVIGVGMAVDANVITYSRIKDELYEGKSLKTAFVNGNKESLVTILDANITSMLVAVILFVFGESSVKGFATMFVISIFITVVVMFFGTRYILKLFVDSGHFDHKIKLFLGAKPKLVQNVSQNEKKTYYPVKKFDFVSNRKLWFLLSGIIIVGGIISIATSGFNLGIDYKGGSNITINTTEKLIKEALTKDATSLGLDVVSTETTNNGYSIRVTNAMGKDSVIDAGNYFESKYSATTDISVVSNIVKNELIKNAILSLIIASIGINIYLTIRYRFSYAIGTVIAILHDALIVTGIFSILKIELNSIFIAALLAIIGYSINDTIVCFDRIKDTLDNRDKEVKHESELKDVINTSIRQMFARSLITSMATLIPVATLLLFGSHEIYTFNIALFIGLISGAYSSIYIAAQVWFEIEKRKIGKVKHKKGRWSDYIDHDEVHEMKVKGINS